MYQSRLSALGDTLEWAERRFANRATAVRVLNSGVLVIALAIVALIGWRGFKFYRFYNDRGAMVGSEVPGAGQGPVRREGGSDLPMADRQPEPTRRHVREHD